ncbi:Choline transporter-like protein 3 [Durusdinium trenchii]|uniref:Choline transporter-like protein 3 n=1 Tax=Durusdinium trenchii TaxID=1381693 RepID=A0ABP0J994_9DINO
MEEGDVSKFFRGFDYYGRMCGRDVCETGPCGRFIYFCARNAEEFPDTAHPICVDSCPTSNLTSHICWDADAMAAVSMPDVPTVEFNMKCLQREHAIKEKEDAKESRLFQGLSRFRGAGSIEGFLMDSLHSLARAKLIVLSTFGVALATSFFYMLFLRYLSGFLIHVSLLLMMIVPACFGLFHLFKVFTSGGLSEVIGGNTEVQTSFLSGIAGMCVALVLCCTLAHISRGIQTAEGCILATTDCMFEIPSILLEPLVSLVLKTLTVGPMVGLMLVYVAWRKGGCAEEPELREPPRCWLGDCGETAGVKFQEYTLPGPPLWIPEDDGILVSDHLDQPGLNLEGSILSPSSGYGCDLVAPSGQAIPCYVVHQPPRAAVALQEVPLSQILLLHDPDVYIFSAADVYRPYLRPDGTLPYAAVIVVNAPAGQSERVTEPRPFDWNQRTATPALVPVVTVSYLSSLLLTGGNVSLRLRGRWAAPAPTRNVLAIAAPPKGCGPGPSQPIYLGTPINGFFRAAGERGAGIALLLQLAQHWNERIAPRERSSRCPCWTPIFGFTSGHEQSDSGIERMVIPYLQELAADLHIPLSEIPFISIGAGLANYAHFDGLNFAGAGSGTTSIRVSSTRPKRAAGAQLVTEVLRELSKDQRLNDLVQAEPGTLSRWTAQGAILPALHAGMPALNLVSGGLRGRFHLPSDADASSVNLTSLATFTDAFAAALHCALRGAREEADPGGTLLELVASVVR